jgi:hypothetical protein
MNEKLLQYIWQFQHFNRSDLSTSVGDRLIVIHPGILNFNQGPDFLDARVRIGNTVFAGAVEVHLKTSQWKIHGHHKDPNYNNVILHVVFEHDEKDNGIPVLELQPVVSNILLERYALLMNASAFIPCGTSILKVKDLVWLSWKERLLVERQVRKAVAVSELLKKNKSHWEETLWLMIARNFGVRVNAEAFEAVAESLPVKLLTKHRNQIHHLEALLFGQAGLLEKDFKEEYPRLLKREYVFLKRKYSLRPIRIPVHFLRMRPGNFPTVRLAQLAVLIQCSVHLFSNLLKAEKTSDVRSLFEVTANDYWHYHYRFDEPSNFKTKHLGAEMISNIIINSVVPIVFAYGSHHNEEKYRDKALKWLIDLPPESNSIISGFKSLRIEARTAYDSQALIELKNQYCIKKRCLECAIGNALLKDS